MEAQELPVTEANREERVKKKNEYFTKLQAFLLLFTTLVVCLVGGYYISDKFLWPDPAEQRLNDKLAYYKDKIEAEPNNPEHRVNLGYTYYLKGDNEDAIKQLNLAVDLDKKYFGAYFNLGLVYIDEKRFNDALTQAQKAVELSPKNYKSHLLAGMVYRHLKMYDEALKSLSEALSLMPTNTDTITEIGRVAEDRKNYSEAEKLYKEALSYDPLYKPATEGLDRIAAKNKK